MSDLRGAVASLREPLLLRLFDRVAEAPDAIPRLRQFILDLAVRGKLVRDQLRLEPGDLLACRFNGNRAFVGQLSMYAGYLGLSMIYLDKLIRLRLRPSSLLPKLATYFAKADLVREEIEARCATTVGNWGISASNLKKVSFPVPPLAEQRRIVAKVDELMALCDRLEAQLAIAEAESRRLLDAVLHEALGSDRAALVAGRR